MSTCKSLNNWGTLLPPLDRLLSGVRGLAEGSAFSSALHSGPPRLSGPNASVCLSFCSP